jgi:spermidine synthase
MGCLSRSLLFEEKGIFHNRVQVVQDGYLRYLRFGKDGGWQGAFHTKIPTRIIFPYQRGFAALVSSLPQIRSFLAFGVGTGTALRTVRSVHPGCELFGVDVEESVIETAISYFCAPSHEEAHYFVGDGVQFLRKESLQYDLIFIDAYLKDKIYSPVLDPAFLIDVKSHIAKAGIVVFNIIGRFTGAFVHRPFYRTLHDQFGFVWVQPVGMPCTEQNALVVASAEDNLSQRWRRAMWGNSYLRPHERIIQPFRLRLL